MFERSWTVTLQSGAGPQVVTIPDVAKPGGDPTLEMEAWGAVNGCNVYIFDGDITLAEAQQRVGGNGKMDCLLTVPKGGVGCVRVPGDIAGRLTVFFDTALAQLQAITVRLREV